MGANPTQAQGVCLFFIGFVLISAGLAANVSAIALILGVALVVASAVLFLKCKPWEHHEE
jgi:membrane-bound ClpP family serine protease